MTDTDLAMTIPSDVRMVAPVRSFMRNVGEALGCDVDSELLALLTTELVTNAIRMQAGIVSISVTRLLASTLRVEVHDAGGGWPQMARPFPLDDDGGRGLMIVDRLADSWGARAGGCDGTTVWFEVSASPEGAAFEQIDPGKGGSRAPAKSAENGDTGLRTVVAPVSTR